VLDKHLLERRQFSEACVEVEELLLADSEELREEATSLEDEVQDQSSQVRTWKFATANHFSQPHRVPTDYLRRASAHNLPIRPTRGAVSHHLSIHPDSHPQPQPQPRPIPRRPQVQHLKIEKMQAVSAIEKIWRQRLDDDTRRLRDEMEGLRGRLDRKEEEAAKLLYVNIGNERKI